MRKEPSCTIFSSSSLSRLVRGERGRRRMGRERISPAISPPSSFQSPDPPRLPPPPPPTSPAAKVVPVSGIFLLSLLLLPPLETRLSSPPLPSPLDPFPSARRWVGGGGEKEEKKRIDRPQKNIRGERFAPQNELHATKVKNTWWNYPPKLHFH